MVDISTKMRIHDIAALGPIKDQEELTRRANIVLFNYLGMIQELIAENLTANFEDHKETRQVLAESFQQVDHLRTVLTILPTTVFLNVDKENADDRV